MQPPTFYLESSVWGSRAPRQPRDRKKVVQRLLRLLDGVRGICVIWEIVIDEIDLAPAAEAEVIRNRLKAVRPAVYPVTDDVRELARAYVLEPQAPDPPTEEAPIRGGQSTERILAKPAHLQPSGGVR